MCTVLLPATAYVDVMLFQQDVTLAVTHNDMGGGGEGRESGRESSSDKMQFHNML